MTLSDFVIQPAQSPGQGSEIFAASWSGKEIPGTISKFLRRTRYLFHNESGSLCFLLGYLLHFHCLRELLAKGQMGLQSRNQAKFTTLSLQRHHCDPRSSWWGEAAWLHQGNWSGNRKPVSLKEQKLGQAGLPIQF